MTSNTVASLLAAVCALFAALAAPAENAPADSPGHDFYAWYEANLKPRGTGVYEKDGDVFFHYRAPMTGSGMVREQKAAGKAMVAVERMVFTWVSSNLVATAGSSGGPFAGIPGSWFDRNAEAKRAISGLPSRVACRGADGADFVYTLVVARSDLLAEAAKGPFEKRPDAQERQWKSAVRQSLTSPDRMAFFRDCGALDLWTILSEKTSGTRTIQWSPETKTDSCRAALSSLRDSAAGAVGAAAAEWTTLLEAFPTRAEAETNAVPGLSSSPRLETMLLSFASCPAPADGTAPPDMDRLLALMDEPVTNQAATAQMALFVASAPGLEMPWSVFGDRLLSANAPHLALSAFRNALRANHASPLALDGLRRCYVALGKPALARGAAALILALSEDGTLSSAAEKTLLEK